MTDIQEIFRNCLFDLKNRAAANGKVLDAQAVYNEISAFGFTDEQKLAVFQYLLAEGIKIDGLDLDDKPADDNGLAEEDRLFYEEYRAELSEEEDLDIVLKAFEEKKIDRDRAMIKLMGLVGRLALPFAGRGVLLADLIGEGNIGLLMALDMYDLRSDEVTPSSYIRSAITDSMIELIKEEKAWKESDDKILGRINYVGDAIKELSDELGRKVTLEELSAFLNMPAQEIADILKLTGEKIDDPDEDEEKQDIIGSLSAEDFKVF